jgi:hypothetical protein
MKKFILLLGGYFFLATNLLAEELNYNWKAGDALNYSATVTDNINMSMMGMNMKDKYTTTVDFVLLVNSVDENGTASGKLYLMTFNVKNSKGISVATLANLPKNAIESDVNVDKKGKFTFANKLCFITTPTTNVLAIETTQNSNSVGMNASGGAHSVNAYAEFDPKTGKLKAGYVPQKIKSTRKINIKENQESDKVFAIPYDFLQALTMPDGDVTVGDHYSVTSGMYNIDILVNSMDAGMANIKQTISTNKSNDMFQSQASGKSGDGSMEFDMNTAAPNNNQKQSQGDGMGMGMPDMSSMMGGNMGGMGMPTEKQMNLSNDDKKAMDMSKSMMPTMSGNILTTFDYTNGVFKTVKGNINTEINTMGVKMTVNSVVEMKGR